MPMSLQDRETGTTLMRQAVMTACDYMANAIQDIDYRLGDGYAADHPELIAAYMKTAAQDYQSGVMYAAFNDLLTRLDETVQGIVSAIEER